MESIGLILQQARQKRKLKLAIISKQTKISIGYLKALEAEDWAAFPASAYARIFLRSYANFLDLNSDEVVREYKKYLETTTNDPVAAKLILKRISFKKLTAFPVAISIVVLIIWGGWFLFFRSPYPAVVKTIEEKKAPLILKATVLEEVWLSIAIDEGEKVKELLVAGDSRTWEAEERLEIRVGNAGGIELEFNGELLESLGEKNQVVTRTFSREKKEVQTTEKVSPDEHEAGGWDRSLPR